MKSLTQRMRSSSHVIETRSALPDLSMRSHQGFKLWRAVSRAFALRQHAALLRARIMMGWQR